MSTSFFIDTDTGSHADRASLRGEIVAAALAKFIEHPYEDVSPADVAAGAGVSEDMLAAMFPRKQDLYLAAVEAASASLLAATELEPGLDPFERLERGLDAFLDHVAAHGPAYVALMRDAVGVDEDVAASVERTRETLRARLFAGLCGDAKTERVRVALRGWIARVEAAALDWLASGERDRDAFIGAAREALIVAKAPMGPVGPIRL